jgi:hypothetical protein
MVNRSRFPDFNSVMNLYSNFKHLQKNDIVPQGCTIWPSLRDVEVAGKAAAGPAMAVEVVVTCVLAGLFLTRKSTR